jgi:hypothetical protein
VNTFEVKIWDDERARCTFYTVQWEGADSSETDKFFERYENETHEHFEKSNELLRLILENIGNKYGAIDDFFDRTKNKAQALPPKPKRKIPEIEELGIHFPLRIYCYRISESIVVLFNGGLKDERTDQLSNDISLKFYEAQQFAERIENGLRDGMIIISEDNRYLTDFNNSNEIIL